jgi:hypothetical protein
MKRNSKKQKGDGNEGLNISKENGIENGFIIMMMIKSI